MSSLSQWVLKCILLSLLFSLVFGFRVNPTGGLPLSTSTRCFFRSKPLTRLLSERYIFILKLSQVRETVKCSLKTKDGVKKSLWCEDNWTHMLPQASRQPVCVHLVCACVYTSAPFCYSSCDSTHALNSWCLSPTELAPTDRSNKGEMVLILSSGRRP